MRLLSLSLRAALLACFFCVSVGAGAQALPEPPEVAAKAWLLMDVTTKQVLAAKDPDTAVEPASLTKLMSAYLVFDALRSKKLSLTQTLAVSEHAWKMPGSRMFIQVGQQVPVEDLIKGMVVQSGNDATMALAEGVGGTEQRFVQLMNAQAKALGLQSTSYKNPDGLTEAGHTTTARDLATLASRLMHDFPEHMHYYAMKKYRYPGTPASNDTNRNLLLFRDPSVDGLKTGHTDAAGYCLVATAQREFPNVGKRRLLSVVLGATSDNSRANESQKLLNWGYTAYEDIKLFDANQAALTPQVWKGQAKSIQLGSLTPIIVTVPNGSAAQIKTEIVRPEPLIAPFKKGQTVGSLKAKLGDRVLSETPLLALEDVDQAGVLTRAWDALRLWIK